MQSDSRSNCSSLADPDFVSSFEYGDHVYFFLREAAVEYINCGKVRIELQTAHPAIVLERFCSLAQWRQRFAFAISC